MTMLTAAMAKMIVSPTEQRKRAEALKRKFYWVEKLQPTAKLDAPSPSPKPVPPKAELITDDEYVERFISNPQEIIPVGIQNSTLKIIRTVAKYYGVSVVDILSTRRTQAIVRPRQVVMFLCRKLTTRSLPEIGHNLGGRDHTTCLHGANKIERLRFAGGRLDAELLELERELSAG